MHRTIPAFTVLSTTVGQPCKIHHFLKCSHFRRPRLQHSALSIYGALRQNSPPPSSDNGQPTHPPLSDESYIQCPQCLAVYQIEADELDEIPRIVACSACLHEWHASEDALLWGDDMALQAVVAAKNPTLPSYVQTVFKKKAEDSGNGVAVHNEASSTIANKNHSSSRQRKSVDENELRSKTPGNTRNADEFESDSKTEVTPGLEKGRTRKESNQISEGMDSRKAAKSKDLHSHKNEIQVAPQAGKEEANINDKEKLERQTETYLSDVKSKNSSSERAIAGNDSCSDDRRVENNLSKGLESKIGTAQKTKFCIFVGNLSFRATEEDLHRAFSGYGVVVRCQIPCDPGGTSKGFGFVEMRVREDGLKAMAALQGASLLGRDISLTEARQKHHDGRGGAFQSTSDDSKAPKRNGRSQKESPSSDQNNYSWQRYGRENSRGKQRRRPLNDKHPNDRRSSPRR